MDLNPKFPYLIKNNYINTLYNIRLGNSVYKTGIKYQLIEFTAIGSYPCSHGTVGGKTS